MKTIITILFTVVFFVNVFAQTTPPPKQWDITFKASSSDDLTAIQQTKDGGYIFGGTSYSGAGKDKSEPNYGLSDLWIIKVDAFGIKQWDRDFGGAGYDNLGDLRQTQDGGFVVAGRYSGVSSSLFWIIKLDSNGNKKWDKFYQGTGGAQVLEGMQLTPDGGFMLAGYSSANAGADKSENSKGGYDYWIIKTDANGNKQWDKTYGSTEDEYLKSIRIAKDGGYIFGGFTNSSVAGADKTENGRGLKDYWVVKTDANGNKQWDKTFGSSLDDFLFGIAVANDGSIVLGGFTLAGINGDKTQPSKGGNDYWVIKLDANGNKLWDKDYGGSSTDYMYNVYATPDGGFICGGNSSSGISGDKSEYGWGGADYWYIKTNANGNRIWDKRYGGSAFDAQSYQNLDPITADGGYIFAGNSASSVSGDKTEKSYKNTTDYWIIKTGCPPQALIKNEGSLDLCDSGFAKLSVNTTEILNYQWLRNNKKIPGATNTYYTATTPGLYKVVAYVNAGCKNISNAIKVIKSCGSVSASQQTTNGSQLSTVNYHLSTSLTPNPTSGNTTLIIKGNTTQLTIRITDASGKIVWQTTSSQSSITLPCAQFANGVYNVQVISDKGVENIKFVKE